MLVPSEPKGDDRYDTDASSTHLEAEIATQPQDWLRAGTVAREHAGLLPRPGERVAVVGCGTSLYMAQAFAELRERAGQGSADAWPASEHRLDRGYDRILAITRSGTTTEVIAVLEEWGGKVPSTVITATPGTPVVDVADADRDPGGRRAVRRADPVRDRHPGVAAQPPRGGPHPGGGAGAAGPRRRRVEPRPGRDRRPDHLRRARMDQRPGERGGAEAAGVRPAVDRVLPDDGVPPRPGEHQRSRPGGVGLRRAGRGTSPTTSPPPERTSRPARSTRWPTCSGSTGSALSAPVLPG